MSNIVLAQTNKLVSILNLDGDPKELIDVLKGTAFKVKDRVVSDIEMAALLIVAQQYKLNPWTRQIYAFPDKQNGIVPVVGVDGWVAIINNHPEYDGVEFVYSEQMFTQDGGKECPTWCECLIYRKDRTRPIVVREYLDEVYRPPFKGKSNNGQPYEVNGPWQSHTKRFLRHKALIQCARVAFGFGGIYDQDEVDSEQGEKIINPLPTDTKKADINAILESIKTMEVADFTTIDPTILTPDEQKLVSAAFKARKKEIIESKVVADIKPTTEPKQRNKAVATDWQQLISDATTKEEVNAIWESMPEDLKQDIQDAYAIKLDMFR
jgi:phage recombination protein Bet